MEWNDETENQLSPTKVSWGDIYKVTYPNAYRSPGIMKVLVPGTGPKIATLHDHRGVVIMEVNGGDEIMCCGLLCIQITDKKIAALPEESGQSG